MTLPRPTTLPSPLDLPPILNFDEFNENSTDWSDLFEDSQDDSIMTSSWPPYNLDQGIPDPYESYPDFHSSPLYPVFSVWNIGDEPVYLDGETLGRSPSCSTESTDDDMSSGLTTPASTRASSCETEDHNEKLTKKRDMERLGGYGLPYLNLSGDEDEDTHLVTVLGMASIRKSIPETPRFKTISLPIEEDTLACVQMYNSRGEPMTAEQTEFLHTLLAPC